MSSRRKKCCRTLFSGEIDSAALSVEGMHSFLGEVRNPAGVSSPNTKSITKATEAFARKLN